MVSCKQTLKCIQCILQLRMPQESVNIKVKCTYTGNATDFLVTFFFYMENPQWITVPAMWMGFFLHGN